MVRYQNGSPDEFALCLCAAGMTMRCATNNGKEVSPHWHVWAHINGIDPTHVFPAEEILTDDELAARGLTMPTPDAYAREAALLAAGRKAKR